MDSNQLRLEPILNRIVDVGIGSILFIAPLAMGARFAPGRLLLAILVAITACCWFFARALARRTQASCMWSTGVEWLACCAVLLVVLQLIPMSPGSLAFFSPTVPELLPLHSPPQAELDASGVHSRWTTVSLAPHATRGGLAMALIYVMLFFTLLQRLRDRHDIERLLKGIALAGVSMATIGLLQYLFGNGRFLWFMEHPSRDTYTAVKGTFANENHFAHFLALTLGPLLWWLVKEQQALPERSSEGFKFGAAGRPTSLMRTHVMLSFGLGIVVLAGLLTNSRGGLAVMLLAAVTSIGLFVLQGRLGKRSIVAVSLAAAVTLCAVWIHGQEILARELATLQSVSIDSLDQGHGRRKIWSAVLRASPDFAMLGSGIGSHRYIYPTYFPSASAVQYTHAESGFLNILLEAGGPGLGLLLVGIGLSGYWLVRLLVKPRDAELAFVAVPLVASWCASLVHGIFDFNWFIPANMCLTLVVLALAARTWTLSMAKQERPPKPVAQLRRWAVATVVAIMSIFSIGHYIAPARAHGAWHEYLAWSLASGRFQAKTTGSGRQRSLGLVDPADPGTVASMIRLLENALQRDPNNGRAHVRMAAMCLRQFELLQLQSDNAMTLAQIRDAALASEFDSHAAMSDWVDKVVGDNRIYLDHTLWHCRQGMRTTPTEGRCYLYLSEVAFLDESLAGSEYDLLSQAFAVRPYDAAVQFVYGRQKLLSGDEVAAMELWKEAFQRGSKIRKRVISAIGFQVTPQELLTVFQPSLDGLRDIFDYYRRHEFQAQMEYVGQTFAAELEKQAMLMTGETAGKLWFEAQFVHHQLGDVDAALHAAQNAVMAYPAELQNHVACALRMKDAGRFEEAIKEFQWCESRQPEEEKWTQMIVQLRRAQRQARVHHFQKQQPETVRR